MLHLRCADGGKLRPAGVGQEARALGFALVVEIADRACGERAAQATSARKASRKPATVSSPEQRRVVLDAPFDGAIAALVEDAGEVGLEVSEGSSSAL